MKRCARFSGSTTTVRWETDCHGPVLSVRTRGLSGPAPLVIVEAQGTLDDLLAKDEKTLLSVYTAEDDTEIVVSGAAAVASVRRRRRPPLRTGHGRTVAADHRTGTLARGSLPCGQSAARHRARRRQARRGD